MHKRKRETH
uniref:Uncharacterized protein n=1 Tax=Oryza meridionalis TaxID=40149 RepID=A0A0G2KBP3_9ORYZ